MNCTSSIDYSKNPLWIGSVKDLKTRVALSYFLSILNESKFRFDRITPWLIVNDSIGCWEWNRVLTAAGYGIFSLNSKKKIQYAHRAFYEYFAGPLKIGLEIDHLCRNRSCVNPDHLEQVTKRENIIRGNSAPAMNYKKKRCKRGHIFSLAPDGKRFCSMCRKKQYKLN